MSKKPEDVPSEIVLPSVEDLSADNLDSVKAEERKRNKNTDGKSKPREPRVQLNVHDSDDEIVPKKKRSPRRVTGGEHLGTRHEDDDDDEVGSDKGHKRHRSRSIGGQSRKSNKSRKSVTNPNPAKQNSTHVVATSPSSHTPAPGHAHGHAHGHRRHTEAALRVIKPKNWKRMFYMKSVYIWLHCLALIIGILSFVTAISYILVSRSFFGAAEAFEVAIFLILALCALGFSLVLVACFGIITFKKKYYRIGYVFNGNAYEILLYVVAFVYICWIASTTSKAAIKTEMNLEIVNQNIELWQNAQAFFHCCGIDSYRDWWNVNTTLPLSCCKQQDVCTRNMSDTAREQVWENGCLNEVAFVAISLIYSSLVLLLLGFIFSTLGLISVREALQHKDNPMHTSLFYEANWMMPLTRGPKFFQSPSHPQNPGI